MNNEQKKGAQAIGEKKPLTAAEKAFLVKKVAEKQSLVKEQKLILK